jgi:hypothetical protein
MESVILILVVGRRDSPFPPPYMYCRNLIFPYQKNMCVVFNDIELDSHMRICNYDEVN